MTVLAFTLHIPREKIPMGKYFLVHIIKIKYENIWI